MNIYNFNRNKFYIKNYLEILKVTWKKEHLVWFDFYYACQCNLWKLRAYFLNTVAYLLFRKSVLEGG